MTLSYAHALQELYSVALYGGIKLGLKTIEQICRVLEQPQKRYPSVHIAGTNGKGSVATKLAAALQAAGYRTGLYTSPHIASFRERFQVDGQLISEADCAAKIGVLLKLAQEHALPATFFELATALAFLDFAEREVDIAIFEVGMGGRLDATNVISPKLSVITSIAMDHAQYLGDSLEAIAGEKVGIIKQGTPVIIGPSVPRSIAVPKAQSLQAPLTDLSGPYPSADAENSAIAKEALAILQGDFPSLDPDSPALMKRPPCRREWVKRSGKPDVILDVAHNPKALEQLFAELPDQHYRVVATVSEGRDAQQMAQVLSPFAHHVHWVPAANGRSLSQEELSLLLPEKSSVHASPTEGLKAAEQYGQDIVACGSFFIMAELRSELGLQDAQDPLFCQEQP